MAPTPGVTLRSDKNNKSNAENATNYIELVKSLIQDKDIGDFISAIVSSAVQQALLPVLAELNEVKTQLSVQLQQQSLPTPTGDPKVSCQDKSFSSVVKESVKKSANNETTKQVSTSSPQKHGRRKPKTTEDIISEPSIVQEGKESNQDTDGFNEVIYKKQRRSRQQPHVVGCKEKSEDDDFMTIEKKIWLYIGRLRNGTKVDQVRSYLNKRYPAIEFECEMINAKPDSSSWSCKVGAPVDLKDALHDPSFWPNNTIVKRYFFRRQTASFH